MHPRTFLFLVIFAQFPGSPAEAGPRTSVSYSVTTDDLNVAGGTAASPSYSNVGSVGEIAGLSTSAAPAEMTGAGYIAQLGVVSGFAISSATPSVNETATVQLGAWQVLDDGTLLAVDPHAVTWAIIDGPLTSISSSGLATAGAVYQNTRADLSGSLAGSVGSLQLTVLDAIPDNFGVYAGDGLPDGWQVQYFGQNNPLAAPGVDADGDGESNLVEYLAGTVPTDPASQFTVSATSVARGVFTMQLSRVQPETGYVFQRSTDLVTWTDVLTVFPTEAVAPLTQSIPASGPKNFFRVRLTPGVSSLKTRPAQ